MNRVLFFAVALSCAPAAAAPRPSLPPAARPTGEVLADDALLQLARTVTTAPGALPRLQVAVGDGQRPLPLEHTRVFAELTGTVARVDVAQTYRNPLDVPIEAVYVFPLPENSAVDDLKMVVDGRVIVAEIRERQRAKEEYDAAKRAGHTAALLEQERPNIFTQSVANIPPGETVEIHLRYVQQLTYDGGEYEFVFPMVVGPRYIGGRPIGKQGAGWSPDTDAVQDASRITPPIFGRGVRSGHDIELEILVDSGLPIIDLTVPTHAVDAYETDDQVLHVALAKGDTLPNRDFVMRYRVDAEAPQAAVLAHRDEAGDGHFALILQPPAADVEALVGRREFIFVVDVSGSMSGAPLALCKAAVRHAVGLLRPVDTFNVYTFAGRTAQAFSAPRPANEHNVTEALAFVDGARAGGGTHLGDAVTQALSVDPANDRQRIVVFLTDGYVGDEAAIFAAAEGLVAAQTRAGRTSRVFGFGAGSSVNRHLIEGLSAAGRGASMYATLNEDPARTIEKVFRLTDHPVLTNVTLDWSGLDVADLQPETMPDLLATRPLVVFGRYGRPGEGAVTVRGRLGAKPFKLTVPVTLPTHTERREVVRTLWARARVASLERLLWGGIDTQVVREMTAVGLQYRVVTPYTSFVAVDRARVVGAGHPQTVVQPVEIPLGVDVERAAPAAATIGIHKALGGGLGGGGVRLGERSAAGPRVIGSAPTVTGSLAREPIQRVIRSHSREIRRLWEKSLRSNPGLFGKIVIEIEIAPDGSVAKARIADGATIKDAALHAALIALVERWRFPPPGGGGTVKVRYPFVFTPG